MLDICQEIQHLFDILNDKWTEVCITLEYKTIENLTNFIHQLWLSSKNRNSTFKTIYSLYEIDFDIKDLVFLEADLNTNLSRNETYLW